MWVNPTPVKTSEGHRRDSWEGLWKPPPSPEGTWASTGVGQARLYITVYFRADSNMGKYSELHSGNTAFFTLVN